MRSSPSPLLVQTRRLLAFLTAAFLVAGCHSKPGADSDSAKPDQVQPDSNSTSTATQASAPDQQTTPPSTPPTADDASPQPITPGSTVITSEELHSDQATHTSVFDGNVVVTGTAFNLTADEMTVLFSNDSKVEHITAIGNVVITQPGRVTHSGQVDYFQAEDKFVLTDQPVIVDNKNQISAPKIILYRTQQTLVTEGKPCKVILINGLDSGPSGTANPSPDNK